MSLTPQRYERLMGHFDALCDLSEAERVPPPDMTVPPDMTTPTD